MLLLQDTLQAIPSQSGALRDSLDTAVREISRLQAAESQYITLLENTNEQLGHWVSFSGAAFTLLAVLVGIGAIAAAWIIWKQGRGHRDLLKEWMKKQSEENRQIIFEGIEEYKTVIDAFLGEGLRELRESLDMEVSALREQLQAEQNEETRKQLERQIELISDKREKVASIGERVEEDLLSYAEKTGRTVRSLMGGRCSNCGEHSGGHPLTYVTPNRKLCADCLDAYENTDS